MGTGRGWQKIHVFSIAPAGTAFCVRPEAMSAEQRNQYIEVLESDRTIREGLFLLKHRYLSMILVMPI